MRPDEVLAAVRKQAEGDGVWVDYRADSGDPDEGLTRAIRGAGPLRPAFAAAVADLLVSPDLRHRTAAVAVLSEVARDIGAGRIAEILRDGEPHYRGVKPAWRIGSEDLECGAGRAVAGAVEPGDTTAIEWLRRMELERPWGDYMHIGVARVDGDWLIARARELVRHEHLVVIFALPPEKRERLIRALAPWPPEDPADPHTFFWDRFWPEEAARLRALMWPKA